jgi:hypothetical protein
MGLGSNTASLYVGGENQPGSGLAASNEFYNGTSWTELADINTARYGGGSSGTSTLGLVFAGTPPVRALTEAWNGSSWTEVNDMATARSSIFSSPAGTSSLALANGGTSDSVATEEWTQAHAIKTVALS